MNTAILILICIGLVMALGMLCLFAEISRQLEVTNKLLDSINNEVLYYTRNKQHLG